MRTRALPLLPVLALAGAAFACRVGAPIPGSAAPASGADPAALPAGLDPGILDRSVSPCDDFYQFACGGWLSRTPIPPDRSTYSRSASALDDRTLELQRTIAEDAAAGRTDPRDRHADKVGDFWAACMDEEGTEARGLRELGDAWARLGRVKDLAGLAEAVGALHRQGIPAAFGVDSGQDAREATQIIGVIYQGGLSLPDRDYYLRSGPRDVAIQEAFRAHVARMLARAGAAPARAAADAIAIYGLERALAEAHWTVVETRDPTRTYNRLDLAGLERLAPRFGWRRYLAALGHPEVRAFSATTPRAIAKLDALLGEAPLESWRAYLRWRLLDAMAAQRALPRALVDEWFAFASAHFSGAPAPTPRWRHCIQLTGDVLGEALGHGFVRRQFGAEGKVKSRELLVDVERAFERNLEDLGWMDAPTRRAAREKLARVANKVGYPERWRDYSALEVDRTSLFRSLLAAQAFEVDRKLSQIGQPLDRGEWWLPPQSVNAYYDPARNEMVFPAGILQPPFFTQGAPDAVNYGAIGMIMGHELTHGFDDEGRRYDAGGNLRDWWTPAVAAEFDRRATCLVDQYDAYEAVEDVRVNGKLTLGENIADLGGVKLALAAYHARRAGRPEPGVAGFTADQTFFVAFAQSWCNLTRPERERYYASIDPHAPPKWRVNGPLANLPAFQEAFSCPAGSPMVRSEARRCALW